MKKIFDIKDRTFQLALLIVKLCREIQKTEKEFVLSKQLLRSGTSIGALIREAQNAESDRDFIHKMAIAQKECDETIYWLDLVYASNLFIEKAILDLNNEAKEILKIIRTIILNKKRNMNG